MYLTATKFSRHTALYTVPKAPFPTTCVFKAKENLIIWRDFIPKFGDGEKYCSPQYVWFPHGQFRQQKGYPLAEYHVYQRPFAFNATMLLKLSNSLSVRNVTISNYAFDYELIN